MNDSPQRSSALVRRDRTLGLHPLTGLPSQEFLQGNRIVVLRVA
jgi:hypothetical protein